MGVATPHPCHVLLGGSFDPVHCGHLALAKLFVDQFAPDELRLVPSGNPWQRAPLTASAKDRLAMLELAFAGQVEVPLVFDTQEILRAEHLSQASYTIDTLRDLRAALGAETCLIFVMGADQLQNLHTWHRWQDLFDLAHICAASRPGAALGNSAALEVFRQRLRGTEDIRQTPHGYSWWSDALAVDISATHIRNALHKQQYGTKLVPQAVLDYIQQHQLYQ